MYLWTTLEFVAALVAILLGAAFFTNAIEILGGRLGMRQGAVGSLLAAVGTALPESMIAGRGIRRRGPDRHRGDTGRAVHASDPRYVRGRGLGPRFPGT